MKANLKVILSGVCVAALLASPAIAKTARHHRAAPSTIYVPSDARGSVARFGFNEGGPYTPSIPTGRWGESRDFQNNGR
jgi:hypothetical protein